MTSGGREDSKVAYKVFSCNISYIKEKANVDLIRLADKLKAKKIISQGEKEKAVDGYTKQTEVQRRGELIDRVHENLRDGIGEAFEIFLEILREEETIKFDKLVAELEDIYDEISGGGSREIKKPKTDSKVNSKAKLQKNKVLTISDLEEVVSTLRKYHFTPTHWDRLCLSLGILYDKLKNIEENYPRKVEQQFREGLSEWLRLQYEYEKYGKPTWQKLVNTLENINEGAVAEGIRNDDDIKLCHSHYCEALKTPVKCRLTKAVVQGEARVGKTAFKSLLLDEEYKKSSTTIAEPRVGIYCYRRDGKEFELLNVTKLEEMVKNALKKNAVEKSINSLVENQGSEGVSGKKTLPKGNESSDVGNETADEADNGFVKGNEATNRFGDESESSLSKEVEEVLKKVRQCSGEENDLEGAQWLYFIDTGGQVEFQKLLPIFMPFAQILILVVNISKELSDKSTAVMHYEDKDLGNGSQAQQSLMVKGILNQIISFIASGIQYFRNSHQSYSLPVKEILKQIISSISSGMQHFRDSYKDHQVLCNLVPKKLQILTIGTHGDKCRNLAESKRILAEKMAEIINTSDDCEAIIKDSSLVCVHEIDGRIARKPIKERKNDKKTRISLKKVHDVLEKNGKNIKIPFFCYFFDIILRVAVKKCGVLQLSTCKSLGKHLKLSEDEVLESLKFLHHINSIIYYHDSEACKDLVFVNIDSLIGILKELVGHIYKAHSNAEIYTGDKDGIIKGKLSKSEFNQICEVRLDVIKKDLEVDIATKLLRLFVELSIATLIDDKYFIPALLPVRDVTNVIPYHDREPLLFYFKKATPMGLFCSVITHLLSKFGYKIATESNFSNYIELEYRTEGIASFFVVLVEQVNCIEVHCEEQRGKGIVREDVKNAIALAAQKHNISKTCRNPEKRFYCPCKSGPCGNFLSKGKKHTVEVETVNEHIFRCSKKRHYIKCKDKKKLWSFWLDTGIPNTSTTKDESASSMKQSTLPRCVSGTESSGILVEESKANIQNTCTSITSSNEQSEGKAFKKPTLRQRIKCVSPILALAFTFAVIAICVASFLLTQSNTSMASTCSSAVGEWSTLSQFIVTAKSSPSGTPSCLLLSKSTLDVANLNEILNALKSTLYEFGTWHTLCLNLGLYEGTLETIEYDKQKSEDQLRSCLFKWLNRADQVDKYGGATVDSLVNALHKIEQKTAAKRFFEKLCEEMR